MRGYGPHNNGEDQELAGRLHEAGLKSCDPCSFAEPFYIYRYDNCSYHLSYMDDSGYRSLGDGDVNKCQVQIGWLRDYDRLSVKRRFAFAPHVNPTSHQPRVELIGPVDAPGGNGPTNGMYALQKALRKRIDEGLDWLTIKSLPASNGAIPWFWNWADRRYAAWWDSQGLPFVQGPNMLFLNSASPGSMRRNVPCSMRPTAGQCSATASGTVISFPNIAGRLINRRSSCGRTPSIPGLVNHCRTSTTC